MKFFTDKQLSLADLAKLAGLFLIASVIASVFGWGRYSTDAIELCAGCIALFFIVALQALLRDLTA